MVGLELVDRGRDGGALGLLLRLLASSAASLALCSATWSQQKLALHRDQRRSAPSGGSKAASGSSPSASAACRRATSSCAASRSLRQVLALGGVHGRIELDQHVARLDLWPSRTWIARTTPVSNGWMTLVRPVGTILPGGGGDDVDRARGSPRRARRRTAR